MGFMARLWRTQSVRVGAVVVWLFCEIFWVKGETYGATITIRTTPVRTGNLYGPYVRAVFTGVDGPYIRVHFSIPVRTGIEKYCFTVPREILCNTSSVREHIKHGVRFVISVCC